MFKYLFKNHVSRLYLSTVLFCTAEYLRLCSMSGILLQNNKIRTQTLLLPLNGAPLCGGGTGVRGFSGGKAPAWLPGLCQEPSRPWVGRGAGASEPTPTSLAQVLLGFLYWSCRSPFQPPLELDSNHSRAVWCAQGPAPGRSACAWHEFLRDLGDLPLGSPLPALGPGDRAPSHPRTALPTASTVQWPWEGQAEVCCRGSHVHRGTSWEVDLRPPDQGEVGLEEV